MNTTTATTTTATAKKSTAKKSTAKKEDNTMNTTTATTATATTENSDLFTFTSKRIYVNETAYDVMRYGFDKDNSVYAFANVDGLGVRIHIGVSHKKYTEAKKAAQTYGMLKSAEDSEKAKTATAKTATAKTATAKATKTLDDYIKTGINGNGWKFVFDVNNSRTRLIFDSTPTEKQLEAINNAGFYYSKAMNSYNKKLTLKAAAAAEALAKNL